MLADGPSRLLFVGHATAADSGRAAQAALHVADERPLTASDLMSLQLAMPPRVALLACASGGDYRFDEATGLVAAIVLGRCAARHGDPVVACRRRRATGSSRDRRRVTRWRRR